MHKFSLLLASLFLFTISSHAKIWRVNNIAGISADFTTIQAAHNGAASGDTLYVEGSPTSYGSLTSTKKLTIIGPGYFLPENPDNQVVKLTAQLDGIDYNVGSEGSTITGMDLSSVSIFCNNIIIRRNTFATPGNGNYDFSTGRITMYYQSNNSNIPVSNIFITQNYGVYITVQTVSTGILISNNYIAFGASQGDGTTAACLNLAANSQVIVQNNIFRRGTVNGSAASSFSNNILVNGFVNLNAALSSNNLASGTQFGTADGNLANVNMASVFEAAGPWDIYWKLKAGSPAIGAGYGGTDAGMYGGSTPYVVSGIPGIPSVYSFLNQPIGSNTDPINVTIKVKSNN